MVNGLFVTPSTTNGNGYKNYNNISVDNANWFDQKFKIFLKDLKIDIIHVNEIFGFSTSMINEAISNNIKVFMNSILGVNIIFTKSKDRKDLFK